MELIYEAPYIEFIHALDYVDGVLGVHIVLVF